MRKKKGLKSQRRKDAAATTPIVVVDADRISLCPMFDAGNASIKAGAARERARKWDALIQFPRLKSI